MIVCHCYATSDREIRRLVEAGVTDLVSIRVECGAGGDCGGCRARIVEVVELAERTQRTLQPAS